MEALNEKEPCVRQFFLDGNFFVRITYIILETAKDVDHADVMARKRRN